MMMLECSVGQRYLAEASGDTDYAAWLILADVFLIQRFAIGYRDIADQRWRAAYESGTHPHRAALAALQTDGQYSAFVANAAATLAEVTLTLTGDARKTLRDIGTYLRQLAGRLGARSPQVHAAERSLLRCLLRLLDHGGYVIRDADDTGLSLLAHNPSEGTRSSIAFRSAQSGRKNTAWRHVLTAGTWTHETHTGEGEQQ
ncbi:hypothetical protein [Flindersiella endophytica]